MILTLIIILYLLGLAGDLFWWIKEVKEDSFTPNEQLKTNQLDLSDVARNDGVV